jgi:hypothetical protein
MITGKTKNRMGGCCPEECITDPKNTGLEDESWGRRRTEVPFEVGQGADGAVVLCIDGWM